MNKAIQKHSNKLKITKRISFLIVSIGKTILIVDSVALVLILFSNNASASSYAFALS